MQHHYSTTAFLKAILRSALDSTSMARGQLQPFVVDGSSALGEMVWPRCARIANAFARRKTAWSYASISCVHSTVSAFVRYMS